MSPPLFALALFLALFTPIRTALVLPPADSPSAFSSEVSDTVSLSSISPSPSPLSPSTPRLSFRGPYTGLPSIPILDYQPFCPTSLFGTRAWTIYCDPGSLSSHWADFSINGKVVRRERVKPYYISGDFRLRNPRPWRKAPQHDFDITCKLSDGSQVSARVIYDCSKPKPSSTPLMHSAMSTPSQTLMPSPSMSPSASMQASMSSMPSMTSNPSPTPLPSVSASSSASVMPSMSPEISMTLEPNEDPRTSVSASPSSSMENSMSPAPSTSESSMPSGRDKPSKTFGKGTCVTIDVRRAKLSSGWTVEGDGIGFRMGDKSTKIVGPDVAPIYYSFVPDMTSRYGIALDMTIGGHHDYNDVWIKLQPGNFQLMKNGIVNKKGKHKGWIKSFHNAKVMRAVLSSSVDGNVQSIASGAVLKKGKRYLFGLAGRSNNVIVHQIVLFACSGIDCQRGRAWSRGLGRCK